MTVRAVSSPETAVTLGILAGGAATRLGGRDKAWLERDGVPQVLMLERALAHAVDAVMVSANRNQERYLAHGLRAVHDRVSGIGPLGGLAALAEECRTPWLLTLPVDVQRVPDTLIAALVEARGAAGAFVEDDDGAQPLVALWAVEPLARATAAAIMAGDHAAHALQARLGLTGVRLRGVRFGNLNTPDDLAAAGIDAS